MHFHVAISLDADAGSFGFHDGRLEVAATPAKCACAGWLDGRISRRRPAWPVLLRFPTAGQQQLNAPGCHRKDRLFPRHAQALHDAMSRARSFRLQEDDARLASRAPNGCARRPHGPASCCSCFAFFAGLRAFVVQTSRSSLRFVPSWSNPSWSNRRVLRVTSCLTGSPQEGRDPNIMRDLAARSPCVTRVPNADTPHPRVAWGLG